MRQFPLPGHKGSEPASRAMQAARRQGKAWEVAELMFANARALDAESVIGFAEQAEVGDMERFKADFAGQEVKEEVQKDLEAGRAAGVRGTPTILVNGLRFQQRPSVEGLAAVIDEQIKRADALIAAGTPIDKVYETLAKENASAR